MVKHAVKNLWFEIHTYKVCKFSLQILCSSYIHSYMVVSYYNYGTVVSYVIIL